jgi:protein-L-isoaspartate(D-aspartate) O-methyltransferase
MFLWRRLLILATLLPLVHCSGTRERARVAHPPESEESYAKKREEMVRTQIEARGVKDQRVLEAMRNVPRHRFVPEENRWRAYEDTPLPIAEEQTISQPYIVALMTELLKLEPGHKVLEIGTGSGYQAAVLSALAGHVYTIEIIESLADSANLLLYTLGYKASVRFGNGYDGWPEEEPFDRIILTAAPSEMPQELVDELKPRGRLIAPVDRNGHIQELVLLEKDEDGEVRSMNVIGVSFVPMVDKPVEEQ